MTEVSGGEGRRVWNSGLCPVCSGGVARHFISAPDRFHRRPQIYTLCRCSECSAVWLPNPPKPEEMSLHYDEDYHRAISKGGINRNWHRHRRLISRYRSSGTVLDIGCSSGGFLKAMNTQGWSLYGIELEPSTAEVARLATGAEIFVGNATDAPFAAESFDVITSFDVLEHVYDPRALISKIKEWLKPGGVYVTMVPNIDAWEAKLFSSYWYGLELPRHLFHFSPRSLRRLALTMDFPLVHLKTPRTCYLEHSLNYLWLDGLEKIGFNVTAPAKSVEPGIFGKAMRKALRLGLVRPFGWMAGAVEAGGSIDAVFQKSTKPRIAG